MEWDQKSVWIEYEGKFYFGEPDCSNNVSDDQEGQVEAKTCKEVDIGADLLKLFQCLEKLQMTAGGINDNLEYMTDQVKPIEQKD